MSQNQIRISIKRDVVIIVKMEVNILFSGSASRLKVESNNAV